MRISGHRAPGFGPSTEIRDDKATQKPQVEEKIKAAKELNNLIIENEAKREIVRQIVDKNAQDYRDQRQE